MRYVVALIAVLVLIHPAPSEAVNGEELYGYCTSQSDVERMVCLGYVLAA